MKSNLVNLAFRSCTAAFITLAMTAMVSTAHAQIVNGNFADASGLSDELTNTTDLVTGTTVPGWVDATDSYNISFDKNNNPADNNGLSATSSYGADDVTLKLNGFTNLPSGVTSFIALDSDFPTNSGTNISQTVNGLKSGFVTVNFLYALDQQVGFTGTFNTNLSVTLDGQTVAITGVPQNFTSPNSGDATYFAASATFNITHNPLGDLLEFSAISTPSGNLPSFVLLTDVTAANVPEPGSLALLSTGLIGLGGLVRSRFGKKA